MSRAYFNVMRLSNFHIEFPKVPVDVYDSTRDYFIRYLDYDGNFRLEECVAHLYFRCSLFHSTLRLFRIQKSDCLPDGDIDILAHSELNVLWIEYNEETFSVNKHHPIMAGINTEGDKEFIGRHIRGAGDNYPGTITDGSKTLKCWDNSQPESFLILMLRYDPEDYLPPIDPVPADMLDATGPLYWRKVTQDYRLDWEAKRTQLCPPIE